MVSPQLNNKIVWITGASSGLGKALAQECAALGAKLVLSARRYDELEKVRLALPNAQDHLVVPMDITDESQVRHAYAQVLAAKRRIDWLINYAGLHQRAFLQVTTMSTERAFLVDDVFAHVFMP